MRRKAEEKKKLGVLAMLDDDDETKQDGDPASGDEDSIDQIM